MSESGNDFSGVNVAEVLKNAEKEANKATEVRLKDYLKQKLIERQNLRVKAGKMMLDAKAATGRADSIDALVLAVRSGDFTGIEPLEISTGKKDEKKEGEER